MSKINVGVIGCGRMGKMHITNILQCFNDVNIKSVVDSSPDISWLQKHGLKDNITDLNSLLNDYSIHAVLIAAASSEHVNLIQACADAKKHIFCEKPIAFTLEGIQQAIDAVNKNGVKFQVGFNRRFDPSFFDLKQRVQQGEVGDICLVRITNRDPRRPDLNFIPRSGGLFLDFNVHDFDTLRFVSDMEVDSIQAFGANLIDPEIGKLGDIDTCVINCKFSNGALATIDASRETQYGYDQRLEVLGTNGGIEAENILKTSVVRRSSQGVTRANLEPTFVERYYLAYQLQMKAFFDYLESTNAESPVDAHDTKQAVALAMAAQKSHKENRVVQIQEIM